MNGFTFFESFYRAAQMLPEEDRLGFYDGIFRMMFDDEEPEASPTAMAIITAIMPTLRKSKNNSGRGGRKPTAESDATDFDEGGKTVKTVSKNGKNRFQKTTSLSLSYKRDKERDKEIGGVGGREKEGEKEKTPDPQVQEVIDHLNAVCGTKYSATAKPAGHIRARLQEGATVEDCKRVIDLKHREWKGTKMEQYLRPQTLFNGEKFEAYRNQKEVKGDKGDFKGWGRDYDPYARYLAASEGGGG